jgi:hypothetical protein
MQIWCVAVNVDCLKSAIAACSNTSLTQGVTVAVWLCPYASNLCLYLEAFDQQIHDGRGLWFLLRLETPHCECRRMPL